jgi:hypothetical protein
MAVLCARLLTGVVVLKREQQRMVGVSGKGAKIIAQRECAMPEDEGVIHPVQKPAGLDNVGLGRIVKLGFENVADGVADGHHAPHADGGGGGDIGGVEAVAVSDEDLPVAVGKRAFLNAAD